MVFSKQQDDPAIQADVDRQIEALLQERFGKYEIDSVKSETLGRVLFWRARIEESAVERFKLLLQVPSIRRVIASESMEKTATRSNLTVSPGSLNDLPATIKDDAAPMDLRLLSWPGHVQFPLQKPLPPYQYNSKTLKATYAYVIDEGVDIEPAVSYLAAISYSPNLLGISISWPSKTGVAV